MAFLRQTVASGFAVLAVTSSAWAQGDPLGPEFRVNGYITGHQQSPAVSSDSAGNFVVAWSGQPESFSDIYAQRYDSTGVPLGAQFRVNSYTTDGQLTPSVASSSGGSFVVTWQSFNQDGSGTGSFAQRYASNGAPLGGQFRVNTYTTSAQFYPRVATDSVGNFVVVWGSLGQDGSGYGVFGQRYASSGTPLGQEFQVNTFTPSGQTRAAVASSPGGEFVAVWQSSGQDGSGDGIFAQRYASAGTPLGGEFRVNSYTPFSQSRPAVAFDAAGNFVVTWQSDFQDGVAAGVFAQRYSATGSPLGKEFRVNTFRRSGQFWPSVAADPSNNFVIAWTSLYQDGSGYGIFAQRYDGTGNPLGEEFRVNTHTTNSQGHPAVACDSAGHFVVVWNSHTQDGSAYGVFGQRYGTIGSVELQTLTGE